MCRAICAFEGKRAKGASDQKWGYVEGGWMDGEEGVRDRMASVRETRLDSTHCWVRAHASW